MKTEAEHAVEVESGFLAGVQANLSMAGGKLLSGTIFKREEHDSAEAVRGAMADRRMYDRQLFARLPHGRGFTVRGYERRFFFGRKLRSVTVATVLAPPGPLLEGAADAPPATAAQLLKHVRERVGEPKVPTVIGVCSPSGFEEEVWRNPPQVPNVRLILVEPRSGGGWRISPSLGRFDEKLCRLFDPEGTAQKIARVRKEIEERSTDLLMGGISAESVARGLDLPVAVVQQAFEAACRADPELRQSKRSGEAMLFRGVASGREDGSMSIAEWIRGLFSREGDEAKKINVLSERRAALSARLDRMYEDIGKLEKRETTLLTEGKETTSAVAKRRLAGQIARLRKDIDRFNTSAAVLSRQINVISTHIHNLELAQTGSVAQLPSSEELTQAAVNAEEILEQLAASDDLVSGLDVGLAETSMSADEAAVLKELESPARQEEPQAAKTAQPAPPQQTPTPERGRAQAEG